MSGPRLRELRLTSFKSFRDAVLPLGDVTVLTGRNSSGKSNAIDGLEVLSRLVGGELLTDALDGRRREGGPVRGGSRGCPPHGRDAFALGCTVEVEPDEVYDYDVRVQVSPELRILSEKLVGPALARSGNWSQKPLYESIQTAQSDTFIDASIHNGKRGVDPRESFRDSRVLLAQIPARIDDTPEGRSVFYGVDAVSSALRGVFPLDPVPHLMRDYVPERDRELRRTGENLSAAIAMLRSNDPDAFQQLVALVKEVADDRVADISITRSDLGDVMLALGERRGEPPGANEVTPAREMSDGLLRFIAIATALLTANRGLDIDPGLSSAAPVTRVLVIIEELENGLHPSQAGRVLRLVRDTSRELGTGVLVTTHSPALLDALQGQLNDDVIVCYRDGSTGYSRLERLTDLDGYARAMASGSLGDLITRDRLTKPEPETRKFDEFARILGLA